MTIKVNGKTFSADEQALTVADVLKKARVENPDMVSVQLNGEFVGKENFVTTSVKEGDAVDFLYFMGGGAGGAIWAI